MFLATVRNMRTTKLENMVLITTRIVHWRLLPSGSLASSTTGCDVKSVKSSP